jgi:2'-5' RNA ligase
LASWLALWLGACLTDTKKEQLVKLYIALEVGNLTEIEQLRSRFDSLANKVPPHMTLVFPTDVVEVDFKKLGIIAEATQPIKVQLAGPTGTQDNLLFLTLLQGNDPVIELHRRLYRELFPNSYDRTYSYIPHVTVGRFQTHQKMTEIVMDTPELDFPPLLLTKLIAIEVGEDGSRTLLESFTLKG